MSKKIQHVGKRDTLKRMGYTGTLVLIAINAVLLSLNGIEHLLDPTPFVGWYHGLGVTVIGNTLIAEFSFLGALIMVYLFRSLWKSR